MHNRNYFHTAFFCASLFSSVQSRWRSYLVVRLRVELHYFLLCFAFPCFLTAVTQASVLNWLVKLLLINWLAYRRWMCCTVQVLEDSLGEFYGYGQNHTAIMSVNKGSASLSYFTGNQMYNVKSLNATSNSLCWSGIRYGKKSGRTCLVFSQIKEKLYSPHSKIAAAQILPMYCVKCWHLSGLLLFAHTGPHFIWAILHEGHFRLPSTFSTPEEGSTSSFPK